MELFFRLFNPGVPIEVLAMVGIVACLATVLIVLLAEREKWNWIVGIWMIAYFFLVLYITVLGRLGRQLDDYHLELIPFWSIKAIRDGFIETLYEKIYNVLLFVPVGALMGSRVKGQGSRVKVQGSRVKGQGSRFWRVVGFGIATSVGIELLQLVTKTGTCETDDVICNSIGVVIGWSIVAGIRKIISVMNK